MRSGEVWLRGLVAGLILAGGAVRAQETGAAAAYQGLHAKPAVSYLFPEQISVAAGKPAVVDLHFQVAPGLHVNSNRPHAEELIPTTLKFPDADGVHLNKAEFPPGAEFAFESNPKEKLSVYTGEFVVHAEIVAGAGSHLVQATLHYQACSDSVCLPPRSIPVAISVIGK